MFLFDELLRLQHRNNCTALQTNPVFLPRLLLLRIRSG